MRWWRIKMFNMKLMTVRKMKRLRICVLMSVRPSGSTALLSATFSALALGASGRMFWTWGNLAHVAASGPGTNLIPVTLAAGTLPQLLFQGVLPVILSISLRMILESCALNAGSPIGFPMGLGLAGAAALAPLLPLPPLPHPGCLGSVVVGMLHPLEGTLICLGCNKDLWSRRSKYKSYGALRGCDLGVRDCLQVCCGK